MAKITLSQSIGASGEQIVHTLIDGHPNWIARTQNKDFGIDLEAELAVPGEGGHELIGKLIKLQIKSTAAIKASNGQIGMSLDRSYLDYVRQFRLPVVLVVVDVNSGKAWYIWLQHWILENEARLAATAGNTSVTVKIPDSQGLESGLNGHLQKIARGEEHTAMLLALRELIVAAATTGNNTIFDGILAVLAKVDVPSHPLMIEKMIDALIGFGANAGFWQTQAVLPQLLCIVDRLGESISREQIFRLVARGDTYSRTGLYALSRLFDHWPEHAKELDLPSLFRTSDVPIVAWYCDIRLENPTLDSLGLWGALGNNSISKTQYGDFCLPNNPDVRDYIMSKWPNRGDSIFIDCLEWVGDEDLQPKDYSVRE